VKCPITADVYTFILKHPRLLGSSVLAIVVPDAALVLILPQPVPLLRGDGAAAALPAAPSAATAPRLRALTRRSGGFPCRTAATLGRNNRLKH